MKIHTSRQGRFPGDPAGDDRLLLLSRWGARLSRLGIAPGAAGNLSIRTPEGFVITRTEVELASIGPSDWVLVTGVDRREDGALEVSYRGDHPPSRDSFVHGTVYRRESSAGSIFHLHDRHVLARAERLGIPSTDRYHPAGTRESVEEIEKLLARRPGIDYFVLIDHGIVAWAGSIDAAGRLVEGWHRRARDG